MGSQRRETVTKAKADRIGTTRETLGKEADGTAELKVVRHKDTKQRNGKSAERGRHSRSRR